MSKYQLFDTLDAATEAALRSSIGRWGVLVPIVKDQHGNIIDGHHRSRIADELGVKYRVDVVVVGGDDEAQAIARTLNTDRRHLDAEMRRQVVAELRSEGHSLRAIAGAVGTSKSQVSRDLSTVPQGTVPDRTIGLDGKSRPSSRPTIIAAKDDKQAERARQALVDIDELPSSPVLDVKRVERIAREQQVERKRMQPTAATTVVDLVDIRCGDFMAALADIPDGSVDAIITDPPYPKGWWKEDESAYYRLGVLARRILKPSGVLAVMTGTSPDMVEAVAAQMARSMKPRWRGIYLVPGPRWRSHVERVATGWKPILIYSHPDATEPARFINDDVFRSDADDKRHHHWGQSEAGFAQLVERLTDSGALVVDPFLGGGTTAVVCSDLGRRFIGCDIDAAAVQVSRERTSVGAAPQV